MSPGAARRAVAEQLTLWDACRSTSRQPGPPELHGPPTASAQRSLVGYLRRALEPLRAAQGLPAQFSLEPGLRLRRTYGRCMYRRGSVAIQVRCTADHDPSRWRRLGSITSTLLHELAHLRYRSHGPRFWALYRRLVERAEAAGLYDPSDRDPDERPRGERKLGARYAVRSTVDGDNVVVRGVQQ